MLERGWQLLDQLFRREWGAPIWGGICGGVTFLLVAVLQASGVLLSLERTTLDARFQHANRPAAVDSSIVLATIDDASISFARSRMKVGWPWPREYYGALVDYLREGGARAVVFDILFPEPDFPRAGVSAERSDDRFAQAMKRAGNAALALHLTPADTMKTPLTPRHALGKEWAGRSLPAYEGALAPISAFQEGAAAVGAVNVDTDGDGVVRRLPLAYRLADSLTVPNLGLAGLRAADEALPSRAELPARPSGSFLLYWYGPGGVEGVFEDQYLSIRSLIVSSAQLQVGETPDVPPRRFKDKTVIVGGTATGLFDRHSTPVGVQSTEISGEGAYPGMEIFATFLSNVRQGHHLWVLPKIWTYVLILLMSGIGAGLVSIRFLGVGGSAGVLGGTALLYLGWAVIAFYSLLWWVPVAAPMLALVVGFSMSSAASYAVEGRKRRALRSIFQRYVSPQVVDEVVDNPDALELGGKKVEGTVFFSDIEGFTSISEQLSPQELVAALNEYFGLTTDVVLDHRAMVDKFIGDAIMAVFGAPVQRPDHAAQACLAALRVNEVLAEHYDDREQNSASFRSRIGIHTGQIVVGNIGTERRTDYTAIGDAVNVAARLEQANKQYGTRVLISHVTYEQARDAIEVREVDLLRVTGKEEPIRLYEVLAPAGDLSEQEAQLCRTFEEGLAAYRAQRWVRARRAFATVLRAKPDDGPAGLYQQRVEERAGESLPATWKGIHDMEVGK